MSSLCLNMKWFTQRGQEELFWTFLWVHTTQLLSVITLHDHDHSFCNIIIVVPLWYLIFNHLWPIFIETNFFNEMILSLSSYLFHNVKWERTNLLDCVNCNFVVKSPLPPLLKQIIVHLACADQNLKTQENIGCYSFHFMVTYCKWSDKMYLNW